MREVMVVMVVVGDKDDNTCFGNSSILAYIARRNVKWGIQIMIKY